MFKWLMHRATAAFERQWNYDASSVHEIIEADPRAAWMFQRATALGKYQHVPAAAPAAAGITAVRHEDCGLCTQLGHGKACTRIVVAGAPVTFEQALASPHRG